MNIKLCPECGVPEQISQNFQWLNSGVMVQRNDITRRVGFLESENLDPLYAGIGRIIGMPIDRRSGPGPLRDGLRHGILRGMGPLARG